MRLYVIQDVAHGRGGSPDPRVRQHLNRGQLIAGLRCRLIAAFGCPPTLDAFAHGRPYGVGPRLRLFPDGNGFGQLFSDNPTLLRDLPR